MKASHNLRHANPQISKFVQTCKMKATHNVRGNRDERLDAVAPQFCLARQARRQYFECWHETENTNIPAVQDMTAQTPAAWN